jgi:hypothetical protein
MRIFTSARRRFEHDELVAADAGVAIGQRHGARRRDRQRGFARVDHHEIVAQAVHLDERECAWRDLGAKRRARKAASGAAGLIRFGRGGRRGEAGAKPARGRAG